MMTRADQAIFRVRRDITLGVLLKAVLLAAMLACLFFSPLAPQAIRLVALMAVIGVWIALSITSAYSSQLAIDSPSLIAAGEFDEAERQIDQAMRAFSFFGPAKLRALHQLALLRRAQRRWDEAAAISRALLSQRRSNRRALTKPSQLILAESVLELNQLPAAYLVLRELYSQALSLDEVLSVLSLQLDYEARIGAWTNMFRGIVAKVQLAELMSSPVAARTQAFLGLAALKSGRPDWADWLRRRVELLADVNVLTRERPTLWDLWAAGAPPATDKV